MTISKSFIFVLPIIIGFVLDLLIGDPVWLYHPVRLMGKAISFLEKHLRKSLPPTQKGEYIGGFILAVLLPGLSFLIIIALLTLAAQVNFALYIALESVFCYQVIACKSLKAESMMVYTQLEKGDLDGARQALSRIVGRDTENLSEEQIVAAVVETVAENTNDGVIAPLFYLLIGGAPLGFLYKAVNTLDSMVGYKNDKYRYFGTASAWLDDIAGYIPARLTAWFMILATLITGGNTGQAISTYKQDRNNHASPNSGHPEAVCAGALGIQLGGSHEYGGILREAKTIGTAINTIQPKDIILTNNLMYVSSVLFCLFGVLAYMFVLCFIR